MHTSMLLYLLSCLTLCVPIDQVADFPEDSLLRCEYCGFSALSLCSPLVRGLSRSEAHASLVGRRHPEGSSAKNSVNVNGSRLLAALRRPLQAAPADAASSSTEATAPENGSIMDDQTLSEPSHGNEVQNGVESTNDYVDSICNNGNTNSGNIGGNEDGGIKNDDSGNSGLTYVGVHLKVRGQRIRGPGIPTPFLPPHNSPEAAQLPGPLVHACCALAMHQVCDHRNTKESKQKCFLLFSILWCFSLYFFFKFLSASAHLLKLNLTLLNSCVHFFLFPFRPFLRLFRPVASAWTHLQALDRSVSPWLEEPPRRLASAPCPLVAYLLPLSRPLTEEVQKVAVVVCQKVRPYGPTPEILHESLFASMTAQCILLVHLVLLMIAPPAAAAAAVHLLYNYRQRLSEDRIS